MTDKEYRIQKARIQKYLDKYEGPLGFAWWKIGHSYHRDTSDDNHAAMAFAHTDWEYRQAHIRWILPNFMKIDEDEAEETVLHELCHVLLGPIECFTDKYADRTELATTNVQRAINWAFKAGEKHAKSK